MPVPQRFVADEMLGRLAKWLRLLGQDAEYYRRADDAFLLRLCIEDPGRRLLTRDTLLMRRRPVARGQILALLVRSSDPFDQLREVIAWSGAVRSVSRCAVCNGQLAPVDRVQVESEVPPYVFRTQRDFSRCAGCARVYWRATHWEQIEKRIGRAISSAANPLGGESRVW